MLDKEGSRLLMELFNRMTIKQKISVPRDTSLEIGDFMYENGYRLVFNKWFLQVPPTQEN